MFFEKQKKCAISLLKRARVAIRMSEKYVGCSHSCSHRNGRREPSEPFLIGGEEGEPDIAGRRAPLLRQNKTTPKRGSRSQTSKMIYWLTRRAIMGTRILLGVTGGIAAYKAAELASRLVKDGFTVDVVMTKNACEFVTPLTFQTIVNAPVYTDSFSPIEDYSVEHISLAERADIAVVCPATANLIGKAASGIADDLLTTVLLAVHEKPRILCPAMNTAMWENPVVKRNLDVLKNFGWKVAEPEAGRLACGAEGVGRLADIAAIVSMIKSLI